MNEWQPIETAPKDGTHILLFAPEEWTLAEDCVTRIERPFFVGFYQKDGYWELAHYSAFSYAPTHWMPLPAPPFNG